MVNTTYATRWETARLASLFSENVAQNSDGQYSNAYQFFYGNIVPKKSYELTEDLLETYRKYTVVQPDDIMLNGLNLNYDFVTQRVASVKETGIITSAYICIRPGKETNASYYTYLLKSLDARKVFHGLGTGIRLTLSWNSIKNLRLPVPFRAEQDQIVRFLDWKTSRINRLINVYKKEIAYVLELKKAIISQTVTRGLSPKAKMKNSGIKWVGDIPQHWEMVPNKAILRKRHIEVGDSFRDFQLLSLTTSGIREKDISDVKGKVPASYEKYQIVRPNDMIFCLFDLDVSAVFAGVSNYNGMITSAYDTTECNEEYISPKYADYWFQFVFSERYYKMYSKNVRYTISFENFGMIKTPVPPRAEQDQIVEFLDKKASAFQRIIDIQAKRIELLKEYKNRLISDVVTGQIDVRDVEIPEYERVEEIADSNSEDDEVELEEAGSEVE